MAPSSSAMPHLAVILFLGFALPSAAGSRRALAACSCECCVAEPSREAAVDGQDDWECVLEQRGLRFDSSPFYAHTKPCDGLCMQSPGDQVFTLTDDPEVDSQHFCFIACAPKAKTDQAPRQGEACGPAPSPASAALRRTGGPQPPVAAQSPAAAQFLLARSGAHRAHAAGSSAVGATANAPSPAAAGGTEVEPWASLADPAPENYMRITEEAGKIKEKYEEVHQGAFADIKKFGEKALDAVAKAAAAVEEAKGAARRAERAERQVRALRENVRRLTREEALRQMPGVLGPIVQRARQEARREARTKAEELERQMHLEAPEAGKRAAAPYEDAMRNAAGTATEYSQRGREFAEQAQVLQLEAQAFQRHANMESNKGNSAKAQRLMRRARTLAERAARLSAEADGFYRTSESITEVNVPEYARQAAQAAYHAEVMVDPDTEPLLPPIV